MIPMDFGVRLRQTNCIGLNRLTTVLQGSGPDVQWFVGGKTNISYNCLDAIIDAGHGDRTAIIWEGEPGDQRTLTYNELHDEVCRFANGLKGLGVGVGDVVSIYMPMTPELAIAMLACARIGAVHSVIFAGFSAEAIADRNNDASAKIQLTSDGLCRRGKILPLKETVDQALEKSPTVENCIVLKRCNNDCSMKTGRDIWWHELVDGCIGRLSLQRHWIAKPPRSFSTPAARPGNPKGFDIRPRVTTSGPKRRFNGCSTGVPMTSIGARPIAAGSPVTAISSTARCPTARPILMYEGAPNHPAEDRFWELVEKYKVTILYTAPTAIRAFVKWGDEHVDKHDLVQLAFAGHGR